MTTAVEILKRFWGYDRFRPPQDEIIEKVIQKKDVIALLPTGMGKSICFQVPTLMQENGLCLVISPLVALMKDQVENLKQRDIKAIALTGLLSFQEQIRLLDNVQYGDIRFLYVSPERLQSDLFQEKLKQLPVTLIAVDEAHCISEWGHDFRPSYLKINILREIFPHIAIIALTATATPLVLKDIEKYLLLKNPEYFKSSIIRDNIKLKVIESPDKYGNLLKILNKNEVTIIYAGSRKSVEQTCNFLLHKGFKSVFFHAGLSKKQKDEAFNSWMSEKFPIMVATNAFGMGIDKPNVRKVVHIHVPNSLENYIQEAGRAGRDGQMSEAVLIEEIADFTETERIFSNSLPDENFIKDTYKALNQHFQIAYGELPEEMFKFNLYEFCVKYNLPAVKAFHSIEILEREGVLSTNQQREDYFQIEFLTDSEQLFEYYSRNPFKEQIIKTLLRMYDGILTQRTTVNPYEIALKLSFSKEELKKQLGELHADGILAFFEYNQANEIKFLVPREDQYTLNKIIHQIQKYIRVKKEKYQEIIRYITNNQTCRNIQIVDYFGEKPTGNCGICDVCESQKTAQKTLKNLDKDICTLLDNFNELTLDQIADQLDYPKNEVVKAIRILLDDAILIVNSQHKISKNER